MARQTQLEKALPWLIGGAVVVGGLAMLGGPAEADIDQDEFDILADAWYYGLLELDDTSGADGVANSSKKSSRAAPSGRNDQPPAAPPSTPPLLFPVENYQAGRGFGWQSAAFSSGDTWHGALDIPAPRGTPVRAVADGVVWDTKSGGACGLRIQAKHTDPSVPFAFNGTYCHLDSLAVGKGPIRKGQVIGYVGDSGNTTGTHLHFAMWVTWPNAFDPGPWVGLSGPAYAWVRNLYMQPVIVGYNTSMEWVPYVGYMPVQYPIFGIQITNFWR